MLDIIVGAAVAVLSGMGVGSGGLLVVYLTLAAEMQQAPAQALNLFFFLFAAGASTAVNIRRRNIAWGCVLLLGIGGDAVGLGLATFTGAGRRFEKKGSYHGADVYDDYAHHPGELHALLTMAKALPYRRIVCAFQPHTYTRTKALFEEFVRELKLPDVLILAEIYAAREQNDIGISSNDLARRIPGAIYCPTLDKVTEALRAAAQPGDLIITVGAGDIYKAGEKLLREN